MVETRMKDLFEGQKKHEEEIESIRSDMEKVALKVCAVDQNMLGMMKQMEQLLLLQQAVLSKDKDKSPCEDQSIQNTDLMFTLPHQKDTITTHSQALISQSQTAKIPPNYPLTD